MIGMSVRMVGPVTLDSGGIEKVLTGSDVSRMVDAAAGHVQRGARSLIPGGSGFHREPGADVVVEHYVARGGRLRGSRAAASVTITYSRGKELEALYGVLSKPALALGAQVRRSRRG